MILNSKITNSPYRRFSKNRSFSNSNRGTKHLKNSDLVRYIDSYLIESKKQVLPSLEKKVSNVLPVKLLSKPINAFYAPFHTPAKDQEFLHKVLNKTKKSTLIFAHMKRIPFKQRKTAETAKSLDDQALICIKKISESRPKSVLNNKVSCIMQTDDIIF